MSVFGVATAHNHIIKAMKALGYTSNENGICRGFASMALQAILAKDLPFFNQRLRLLLKIPVEDLTDNIDEIKKKSTILVKEAKLAGLPLKNYNVDNHLTTEEKALLDILSFFDGIELYQQSSKYKHLYENGEFEGQNFLTTAPIISSNAIKNQGGIIQALKFGGIYNKAELIDYFASLKEAYKKNKPPFNHPISLLISSVNHSITVGFDGKDWIFMDANNLPTQTMTNESLIANHVLQALSKNEYACVSTEVYTTRKHQAALEPILNAWKKDPRWKKINTLTPDKRQRYDSYKFNLIALGITQQHLDIVEHYVNDKSTNLKPADTQIQGENLSLLAYAVVLNNLEMFKLLLKSDINDSKKLSALFELAVLRGNFEIAKIIIQDPRFIPYGKGNLAPPLILAVVLGDDELIKMLLADKRVDPTIKDEKGIDALCVAAAKGIAKNVKLLLEHPKVKIDKDYFKSSHPLYIACESGYPEVIALILNKMGIDSKRTYSNGMTAVQVCYYSLLTKNVDTAKKLFSNQSTITLPANYSIKEVLYEACQRGHLEMVKDILKRNKTVLTDPNGLVAKKAIQHAIDSDHIDVLKLLLKSIPPLDSFTINNYLLTAAINGTKESVDFLLMQPLVDPNVTDANNFTPLHLAVLKGNLSIVNVLLANERTDINRVDKFGRSAFMIAAKNNQNDILAEILKHEEVDPNIIDVQGNNAIKYAIDASNYQNALLILSNKRFNILQSLTQAALTQKQLIALYTLACAENNLPVIQALLDVPKMDVNGQIDSHSHFYRAIANNQPGIADTILQNRRFNLETTLVEFSSDSDVNKLMNFAIENGKGELLKVILGNPTKDFNGKDENGNTSLNKYIRNRHFSDALALLISNPKVDINAPSQYQYSPLFELMAYRRDAQVLKLIELLVKRSDLKPNVAEKSSGWTALHYATYWGQADIVKLLLSRKDIDLSVKSVDNETALDIANNQEIIALLKNYELKQKHQQSATVNAPKTTKLPRPLPVPPKKAPKSTDKENTKPTINIRRPLPVPPKKAPLLVKKEVAEDPKPKVSDDKKPNTPRLGGNSDT